ncbi:MAG: phosphoribosylanthranilate isomerase [bacterium]|nr:MAG: phosphoribosylanthranilate isomerase [bacterium]
MFIKICGITNLDDALSAVKFGASALGFIFAPSKRRITAKTAKEIISHLPPEVLKVGVFVNDQKEEMFRIAEEVKLSCIQLHGSESQELCDELSKSFQVIKAVKIDPEGNLKTESNYNVWKLLMDTYLPRIEGGSGVAFNWQALKQFNLGEIIVAGGITPENVRGLLSHYQPFGIDVSSGVESFPGKKDTQKLAKLFLQIKKFKRNLA